MFCLFLFYCADLSCSIVNIRIMSQEKRNHEEHHCQSSWNGNAKAPNAPRDPFLSTEHKNEYNSKTITVDKFQATDRPVR